MCHSSDSILCEPVPGGAGFKISAKNDGRFKREFREFHIEPLSPFTVAIYNGTLFGSLPTGFSVGDNPIATLAVANGNKIYAKVTWNRTVGATGTFGSTITTRTIEAAAAVPTDDYLTATRHFELASVTVTDAGTVGVNQTRWGPIGDLPGTASNNYFIGYPATSTAIYTDYYDLLYSNKGNNTAGGDIAPTYDSVQTYNTGLTRVLKDGNNLKIFIRPVTINSVGQITYIGPEVLQFDETVI